MEYSPPPRDPESERRGHELRDVALKPVLFFLIGLMLFGGALQFVMSSIMTGYVAQDTKAVVPPIDFLQDEGRIDAKGALQRDTTKDMLRMYAEEDKILKISKPARDRRTGKVLVSIDEAISIMAKKGLPHRETMPKLDPEPYQYSEKARAYQTTN